MIISGTRIRELCTPVPGIPDEMQADPMLHPFCERTKFEGVTHGLGPAGYDVRIEFDKEGLQEKYILRPGKFMLASTIERFVMPFNLIGIVHDKSTWARRGIAVQNTVIEPGWYGYLTLELTNHGHEIIHLKRGMGIAQILFHRVEGYIERYDGKYQNQRRGPVKAL